MKEDASLDKGNLSVVMAARMFLWSLNSRDTVISITETEEADLSGTFLTEQRLESQYDTA